MDNIDEGTLTRFHQQVQLRSRAGWRRERVRRVLLTLCVLFISLGAASFVRAQNKSDRVTVEVFKDGIRLHHESGVFFAPYIVVQGDTFTTLAQKYYGTADAAGTLAEANGVSPLEPLEPGAVVYIITSHVDLRLSSAQSAAQLAVIQRFLASMAADTPLTYAWDEAQVAMDLQKNGEWKLKKYDTAKLRLFPANAKKPELQLRYRLTPLLQIITGNNTVIDEASVKR